jgi:hypothetical protein
VLWAVLALACARLPAEPEGLPLGDPLPGDDPRVTAALEAHRHAVTTRRALRGTARVMLEGPDFRLNRPQRLALERPARLRFEILAPFDQVAAILTTDGDHFEFYDAAEGGVQRGRVTASLLWDLAKIDLDPDELVGILMAAPALAPELIFAGAWLDPSGHVQLAFAGSAGGMAALRRTGGRVVIFDAESRLAEFRAIEPGGGLRYRARFEDPRSMGSGGGFGPPGPARSGAPATVFPKRITLDSPRVGASARFVWSRVIFEQRLSDRIFRLPADPL